MPRVGNKEGVRPIVSSMDEKDIEEEHVSQKWDKFHRVYTESEKRKIVAKCIQSGIEVGSKNYIYWYHCGLYHQRNRGVIGVGLNWGSCNGNYGHDAVPEKK